MREIASLDSLLGEAVGLGGSDLHISVGAQPRVRVHGVLRSMDYPVVEPRMAEGLLFPLMDTYARSTLNTVGQYDMAYYLRGVSRFRVNIFKQKGDLAAVFRVLNETVPEYSKLGLPVSVFNMYNKRRGMILIVGPTGSGKSTTLASFLDVINRNTYKHIITLEDPIEYLHWHSRSLINQREIGTDCDSFANGLRAALREDPDVILVGEMRDMETTEIALAAAETGHLLCSTLHTLGAGDTVNRIVDMFPERQHNQVRNQLVSVLEAVVSQQLLPRKDGTGFVVAYEVMYRNKQVKELIRGNRVDEIAGYLVTQEARSEGMVSMDEVILQHYSRGVVTRETAVEYAFDRKWMLNKVNKKG